LRNVDYSLGDTSRTNQQDSVPWKRTELRVLEYLKGKAHTKGEIRSELGRPRPSRVNGYLLHLLSADLIKDEEVREYKTLNLHPKDLPPSVKRPKFVRYTSVFGSRQVRYDLTERGRRFLDSGRRPPKPTHPTTNDTPWCVLKQWDGKEELANRYRATLPLSLAPPLLDAFDSAMGRMDEPPSSEPITRKRLKLLCEVARITDLPISMLIHQADDDATRTLDRFHLPEPVYTPHKTIVHKPDGTEDIIESFET
jgi:hypothetical protein